jgi:hypothetical protein
MILQYLAGSGAVAMTRSPPPLHGEDAKLFGGHNREEILVKIRTDLEAFPFSVCVFVSVIVLRSDERVKRLTSPMLCPGISKVPTMSKVESLMRWKDTFRIAGQPDFCSGLSDPQGLTHDL